MSNRLRYNHFPIHVFPISLIGGLCTLSACDTSEKSTEDGYSDNAPDVSFYAAMGEECCGEDPHPVHGVEATDGGFVLCGKSIDESGGRDGFIVKIGSSLPTGMVYLGEDSDHSYSWSQTFGSAGTNEVANAVASLSDAVFVVGMATSNSGQSQRLMNKYDSLTGTLIWSQTFSESTDGDSAFESVVTTSDGGLILAGYTNGEEGSAEGFKSYGNPIGGEANVMYFSSEQLQSSSPPTGPTWEQQYEDLGSVRSIRVMEDMGYVFVASKIESLYEVVRIDMVGVELWRTALTDYGEATDIAVLEDNGEYTGFSVVGHVGLSDGGIDGSVSKLNLEGGIEWMRTYGDPIGGVHEFAGLDSGNPRLIFDECWGVQPTNDGGMVVACGTGIEGCDEYGLGSGLRSECRSDPRTKWRSLILGIDALGEQVWHRTDSYYFDEETEAAASASEYMIATSNGTFASVIDQDFGIGLLQLEEILD